MPAPQPANFKDTNSLRQQNRGRSLPAEAEELRVIADGQTGCKQFVFQRVAGGNRRTARGFGASRRGAFRYNRRLKGWKETPEAPFSLPAFQPSPTASVFDVRGARPWRLTS